MTDRSAVLTVAALFAVIGLSMVAGGGGHARAVPEAPAVIAATPAQVALTASYSIIGGTASNVLDVLTYVSNGIQTTAILSGTPTVYNVDSGTSWSAQSVLNGSTGQERWMTTQGTAGTIGAPLTISLVYHHQYFVTFDYKVVDGGAGYSSPQITFTQFGASTAATTGVEWVDASTGYSYQSQLPGSSSSERWLAPSGTSGTVSKAGPVTATYYHQYLVTSSYSLVGGGGPAAPVLSGTALNSSALVTMSAAAQTTWLDAGTRYSFTSSIVGTPATQRWVGTTMVTTPAGSSLSFDNNGTVSGAVSVSPAYYHQFLVNVDFSFVGGNISGLTPPAFTYQYFGAKAADSNNTAVWADSGTPYAVPETVCCTASPGTERWVLTNTTTGSVTRSTKVSSTYYHQYLVPVSYSVGGQPPPGTSAQPNFSYVSGGNAQILTLTQSAADVWADAGSAYSAPQTLSSSTGSERWFSPSASGAIGSASVLSLLYTHQYLLTIVGGAVPAQWVDAGSNATLATPAVFGRSTGTGSRISSYQVSGGAVVATPTTSLTLSIALSVNGPQTVTFQSVKQFQVSLDPGAAASLRSITAPTIAGDSYWYDSGSPVQVVLSGVFGRSHGVGQRLSAFSATGQGSSQVSTAGDVRAFSASALQSPVSITTTSVTQYAVVLNSGAQAAFASVSPPSTIPNDTYWYDSGSPSVTVVLNGAFGRAMGVGSRVSSWELDSGAANEAFTTGTITVVTKAMTSPHFLNATTVTQYQLTLDAAAATALSSISPTPVAQDGYWYDSSTPVTVTMHGVWGRSAGTGQRLSSYSIDGGAPVAVQTSGLVEVLNATKLSAPESVAIVVATQYQVVLDSGASSALSAMTAPAIAHDANWYDSGTLVTVSLNGVWGRSATGGSRLLSYSMNQGASTAVASASTVQVFSGTMQGSVSITTKTTSQYLLTSSPVGWISVTDSTVPGDSPGWFDSGTNVKAVFEYVWNATSSGSRSDVAGYSLDGGTRTNIARSGTGNFSVALSMTRSHAIALVLVTQYRCAVLGPPRFAATPPSPTRDAYFDAGSKVTLTVPTAWNAGTRQGVRDLLESYSVDGQNATILSSAAKAANFTTPPISFAQPHAVVFNAITQYEVSFRFFDSAGKDAITPSLVQLDEGNGTVDVAGQTEWLTNGTSFRVVNVVWEGAAVGPVPAPSFEVAAAPLNVTLDARVYDASLKILDMLGQPVSGAQVSMTLANGTTITGTTGGDGTFTARMVPLGPFQATVSSLGMSAQVEGNPASSAQPAQGRIALSLMTTFALAAVAAAAAVSSVLLLRIRKGRARSAQGKE